MIIEWRSGQNFCLFCLRDLEVGIWGAFGISFDVPNLEGSELTMEAKLYNDPRMEVSRKLLSVQKSMEAKGLLASEFLW